MLCRAVRTACTSHGLVDLADALLVPTAAETGISIDRVKLGVACEKALLEIHDAIHHDAEVGTGLEDYYAPGKWRQ
jgi:hypothetical protein